MARTRKHNFKAELANKLVNKEITTLEEYEARNIISTQLSLSNKFTAIFATCGLKESAISNMLNHIFTTTGKYMPIELAIIYQIYKKSSFPKFDKIKLTDEELQITSSMKDYDIKAKNKEAIKSEFSNQFDIGWNEFEFFMSQAKESIPQTSYYFAGKTDDVERIEIPDDTSRLDALVDALVELLNKKASLRLAEIESEVEILDDAIEVLEDSIATLESTPITGNKATIKRKQGAKTRKLNKLNKELDALNAQLDIYVSEEESIELLTIQSEFNRDGFDEIDAKARVVALKNKSDYEIGLQIAKEAKEKLEKGDENEVEIDDEEEIV